MPLGGALFVARGCCDVLLCVARAAGECGRRQCGENEEEARVTQLLAYGAGLNSTALIVGMVERGEQADAVVFADTGGELPETYRYLTIMDDYLAANGWPAIVTVRRAHNDGETLEANCLRYGKLPSIAYGFKTCSTEYKKRPSERWARAWPMAINAWARGEKVIKLLGYDADEPHRFTRIRQEGPYVIRCPLIDWSWGRDECVEAVARAGLPTAPKSSCFFCPSKRPPCSAGDGADTSRIL